MATKRMGKYELGKDLGSGNFSKVRLGTDTETGEVFAVKVIDKQQLVKEHLEDQLKREIAVLKLLRHRNIVQMREVLQTGRNIYLVLELVPGGELFDKIVEMQRFPEPLARKYFQQLICGVRYCHTQNIAHRDLKPENLLIDKDGNIKISDFGLSNLQSETGDMMQTVCGTPNYIAPEVIRDRGYNGFTADVWSCGVILYVMLSGHQAFDDQNLKALFNKIERGDYRMSRFFSESARDLISRILVVDAAKRYTIDNIIAHPWFQEAFDPALLSTDVISVSATDVQRSLTTVADQSPAEARLVIGSAGAGSAAASAGVGGIDGFGITRHLLSPNVIVGAVGTGQNRGGYRALFLRCPMPAASKMLFDVLLTMTTNTTATKDRPEEIKGFLSGTKGLLTFACELHLSVHPGLTFVEIKKGRGDVLDFQTFVHNLHLALGPEKLGSLEVGGATA